MSEKNRELKPDDVVICIGDEEIRGYLKEDIESSWSNESTEADETDQ